MDKVLLDNNKGQSRESLGQPPFDGGTRTIRYSRLDCYGVALAVILTGGQNGAERTWGVVGALSWLSA